MAPLTRDEIAFLATGARLVRDDGRSLIVMWTHPSFTCPCCGAVTRHPDDARSGYCPRCHWWTGSTELGPPHMARPCGARPQQPSTDGG